MLLLPLSLLSSARRASAMTVCSKCGESPAPSGTAPNKYCKVTACQEEGMQKGHIKRPRGHGRNDVDGVELGAMSSPLLAQRLPQGGTITKLEKIYGSR